VAIVFDLSCTQDHDVEEQVVTFWRLGFEKYMNCWVYDFC